MNEPETSNSPGPVNDVPARFRNWHLFEGVRTRRVFAFMVDYALVLVFIAIAVPVVALVGIITLGAGWLLYAVLAPLVALTYFAMTIGGPRQATLGMRMTGIRLTRYDGQHIDAMTAMLHAVLFWAANAVLTPFIVLVGLFTRHKRLLHDLALGIVAVRDDRFDQGR